MQLHHLSVALIINIYLNLEVNTFFDWKETLKKYNFFKSNIGLLDGLNLNNYIERYDILTNIWTIIDAKFDLTGPLKVNLREFRL
jgi:hypothetical protein